MPTTTNRGYDYPPNTGAKPDVPYWMQQLAEALDVDVQSIIDDIAALQGAYVKGRLTLSTDANGKKTITHNLGVMPSVFLYSVESVNATVDNLSRHGEVFASRTASVAVVQFWRDDTDGPFTSQPIAINWAAFR